MSDVVFSILASITNQVAKTSRMNYEHYPVLRAYRCSGYMYIICVVVVEVTLKGPINTKNGMVINLTTLQSHMQVINCKGMIFNYPMSPYMVYFKDC